MSAQPLLDRVLAEVSADVRQRLGATALALLAPEDWAAAQSPLNTSTPLPPHTGGDDDHHQPLLRHVQMRCAELPMRLQTEALQVRRYEHLLRQHTRELVTLSEFVALVSRTPPALAAAAGTTSSGPLLEAAQLPADVRALLAPEEVEPRLERCRSRIRELEVMSRQDAEAKVRCCQRMVLLSVYVQSLVQHAQTALPGRDGIRGGSDGGRASKRPRTESAA